MQFYLSFWIAVWENYLETYFLIFLTIYPLIKLFKTHTTYPLIFLVRLKNQRANSQPCMFIAPPYFKSLHATPHFTHPHCIPPHCTTTHHPFDKYNRRIYNIYIQYSICTVQCIDFSAHLPRMQLYCTCTVYIYLNISQFHNQCFFSLSLSNLVKKKGQCTTVPYSSHTATRLDIK